MNALILLYVAAGGLVGAPTRFLIDRIVADRIESDFPFGTFLINMSGSFLLGLLTGLALGGNMPILVKAFLSTGFCGAYTTFSTWSFETIRLIEEGDYLKAFFNAIGSLLIGLLSAGAGIAIGLL